MVKSLSHTIAGFSEMKYDAKKEEEAEWQAKLRELARIEESTKKIPGLAPEKEAPREDTFQEKLVSAVIRNLQVQVRNIHVRYEDEYTNFKHPFSAGITLKGLDFQVKQ